MIPSLFTFTLLWGIFMTACGFFLFIFGERFATELNALPRNRVLGVVTMLLGGGWFIWKILQLGPADFGNYKELMALLFAVTLVSAIFYVEDFLAVRGLSIIALLTANVGLKSAFALYDVPERLLLVTVLYGFIVGGIIYGIMPYLMRDTMGWLTRVPCRLRALGGFGGIIGLALIIVSFTY
jgi:hypothetical protein